MNGIGPDEVLVSEDGILVRKSLDAGRYEYPAVVFTLKSNRAVPTQIRLADTIPASISIEQIGFHTDFGGAGWTKENKQVRFQKSLDPGQEYTTMYAVKKGEGIQIEDVLSNEPTIDVLESSPGITVQKSVDTDHPGLSAVISLQLESESDELVTIRLADQLPESIPKDHIHTQTTRTDAESAWRIKTNRVELEQILRPGEQTTATYTVREADRDRITELQSTDPKIIQINPGRNEEDNTGAPLRLPADGVYSVRDQPYEGPIAVVGRIVTGTVHVGDLILFQPSDVRAQTLSIRKYNGEVSDEEPILYDRIEEARQGENVGLVIRLIDEDSISSGDVVGPLEDPPAVADSFQAQIEVTEQDSSVMDGVTGERFEGTQLRTPIASVGFSIESIDQKLDRGSGEPIEQNPFSLKYRDVGVITVTPDRPLPVEPFSKIPALGTFNIIHPRFQPKRMEQLAEGRVLSVTEAPRAPAWLLASVTKGRLMSALEPLTGDEVRIHVDGSGLRLQTVDSANGAMTDLTLGVDAFEFYDGAVGLFGVDCDRLAETVEVADDNQLVGLQLEQESRSAVTVIVAGLEQTLALVDPDSIRPDPTVPDLDLPARVVIEGQDLARAVKAADVVSEDVTLGVDADEEYFYVYADAGVQEDTDIRVEFGRNDLTELIGGDVESRFTLGYLGALTEIIPEKTAVTLDLGEQAPLRIFYEFSNEAGHVTHVLAPRVEEASSNIFQRVKGFF